MQTISLFGTLLVVATLGATSVHADKQAKMNKRLATCEKKSKVVHKKIANLKSDIGDALESAFGCNAGKYAASDDVACQVWTNPTADDCADGSIWTTGSATEDSTCVPCAAGHFSWGDNVACQVWTNPTADDCANGSIWTTGSTTEDSTCVPCAAGQFSASDNAACAPHTSCGEQADGSTRLTGASSTAAGSCEVCDGKTLAESATANCVPAPLVFQAEDVSTSSSYQGYTAKWSVDGKVQGGTVDGKFVGIISQGSRDGGHQIPKNSQTFTMSNPGGGTDGEWWSVKVSDTMAPITLASVTITQVPYVPSSAGNLLNNFDAYWDTKHGQNGVAHPALGYHEIWIGEEPGGHGAPGNTAYNSIWHPKGQATKCGGETAPNGKEDYEHTTSVSCGTVQGKYVTIWLPPCCHRDFYGGTYDTFGTRKNLSDIPCVKSDGLLQGGLARNISESEFGCGTQGPSGPFQAEATRTFFFDEVVVRATVGEP